METLGESRCRWPAASVACFGAPSFQLLLLSRQRKAVVALHFGDHDASCSSLGLGSSPLLLATAANSGGADTVRTRQCPNIPHPDIVRKHGEWWRMVPIKVNSTPVINAISSAHETFWKADLRACRDDRTSLVSLPRVAISSSKSRGSADTDHLTHQHIVVSCSSCV